MTIQSTARTLNYHAINCNNPPLAIITATSCSSKLCVVVCWAIHGAIHAWFSWLYWKESSRQLQPNLVGNSLYNVRCLKIRCGYCPGTGIGSIFLRTPGTGNRSCLNHSHGAGVAYNTGNCVAAESYGIPCMVSFCFKFLALLHAGCVSVKLCLIEPLLHTHTTQKTQTTLKTIMFYNI